MRRLLLAALVALAAGCNLGPLGGSRLSGERVREPVRDWSFAANQYVLEIETRASALLPSARTWFVVHDGTLWLYAMAPRSFVYPWVRRLRQIDPGVSIRVDGKLYAGRATLVTEAAAIEPLLPSVLRKYHMVDVTRARFASPQTQGTQLRHWFFRVDPDVAGTAG